MNTYRELETGYLLVAGACDQDRADEISITFSFESKRTNKTYYSTFKRTDIEKLDPIFARAPWLLTKVVIDDPASTYEHEVVILNYRYEVFGEIFRFNIILPEKAPALSENELLKKKIEALEDRLAVLEKKLDAAMTTGEKSPAVQEEVKDAQNEIHRANPSEYDVILSLIDSGVPSENIVDQYRNPIIFGLLRCIASGGSVPADVITSVIEGHKKKDFCGPYGLTLISVINKYITQSIGYRCEELDPYDINVLTERIEYLNQILNTAAGLGFKDVF